MLNKENQFLYALYSYSLWEICKSYFLNITKNSQGKSGKTFSKFSSKPFMWLFVRYYFFDILNELYYYFYNFRLLICFTKMVKKVLFVIGFSSVLEVSYKGKCVTNFIVISITVQYTCREMNGKLYCHFIKILPFFIRMV